MTRFRLSSFTVFIHLAFKWINTVNEQNLKKAVIKFNELISF